MYQLKRQERSANPIRTSKSYDYSSNLIQKQLKYSSNFMKQPIPFKSTAKKQFNDEQSTGLTPESSANKQSLKRVNSLKSVDINIFKNHQRVTNKFQDQTPKRNNKPNKFRDIEHKKLNDKLFLIEQKVLEMKNDLLKKKQEKQRIIKQQEEQRQRRHKQRYLKAQINHAEKQKKRIPNITVEQRIKQISKTPLKLANQKSKENYNSTALFLENKQNSIIQDLVTQQPQPQNIHLLTSNPYSPRSNLYYVSEIIKTYQENQSLPKQHLIQSLQIMRTLQSTRMPSGSQIERRKLNLIQKKQHKNKKTLIFDLDETLIHCNSSLSKNYDVKISIKFQNGTIVEAGVNIRPYAKQILRNLHKQYQIIVFTASQSCYADQVLKALDPENEYIAHRLYREHCYLSQQGMYIKDLRIINREMSQIILVDNAAYSYFFQLENGIPIISYYQGSLDFELKELQKYLRRLNMQKDIRKLNRDTFKLHRYHEYYNTPKKLVEDLYINKI